jgi:hypothetical protein
MNFEKAMMNGKPTATSEKLPKAPKGFLGTLADLLKAPPAGGAQRRPRGAVRGGVSGSRQPGKPCGGCGK